MDYDKTNMAANYDAARSYSPAMLNYWLEMISRSVAGRRISGIVDLGCGTGRYSEVLAAFFDARVIAIDPSDTMLAEAKKKATGRSAAACFAPMASYVCAPAQRIVSTRTRMSRFSPAAWRS